LSASNVAPVHEGDLLAGKYRVERVIGAGGMGVVVAAQHLQLGKLVAVKFLLPQVCANAEAVGRFLREARAAVQLESEHVARVIDVGTLETGAPYMVMEYLVGADLGQVLQARGPLPIEEAVDYVLQACEAIAEAHALGIVHRDLKPANLFLTQRKDGSALVKVLDFGISKATGDEAAIQPSLTATSAVMGSPQYMSPEQMRSSKNVDSRTDIWSLGMILYELLAGRPAYEADTLPGLCAMIATDPPPPLRKVRPDVPAELEAVVMRCLAKDPEQRVHDVGELATALLAFGTKGSRVSVERTVRVIQGAGLSASALMLPPSSRGAAAPGSETAAAWGTTRPSRSRSWLAAAGVGAALLAIGVGVVVWRMSVSPAVPVRSADSASQSSSAASAAAADSAATVQTPAATASASASVATQSSEPAASVSPEAAMPAAGGAAGTKQTTRGPSVATGSSPAAAGAASERSPKATASKHGTPASSGQASDTYGGRE
jgi:hypothetical protein